MTFSRQSRPLTLHLKRNHSIAMSLPLRKEDIAWRFSLYQYSLPAHTFLLDLADHNTFINLQSSTYSGWSRGDYGSSLRAALNWHNYIQGTSTTPSRIP